MASSNYESHSYNSGPAMHREYHEYRTYSSSAGGNHGGGEMNGAGSNDDFNLERQVQHMLPQSTTTTMRSASPLPPSANMVSQQQQKHTYSSYKVQSSSNQYSTTSSSQGFDDGRPGSKLKQNIDELDTLLYDLNNAKKVSDVVPSSDDYSTYNDGRGGGGRRTVQTSSYEQSYHTSGGVDLTSKKPPSPLPPRRANQPSLPSPSSTRRASPSRTTKDTLVSYNYNSSYATEQQQSYRPSPYSAEAVPPPPPTSGPSPSGAAYYAKYHSKHTHQSQQHGGPPTATFPSQPQPPRGPSPGPMTQTPPKRVEQLMTELSEYDSTIRDTRFVEPAEPRREPEPSRPFREPSPERPRPTQPSTAGPAVYYPPGEMFNSSKSAQQQQHQQQVDRSYPPGVSPFGSSRGKAKAEYEYKAKEKSKRSEGEEKQGAAVVPICLPLCCAAPCVIM